MDGSGAPVAAETGPGSRDTQVTIPMGGTSELQGDKVSGSKLNVLPELHAGQQPVASNIGGEDLSASKGLRDDSDQQGSPQGHQSPLSSTSGTGGDGSQESSLYSHGPPQHGDSGVYMSAGANDDAEEVARTGSKVRIVYPEGGEETDAVNYAVGALLLAKALGATVDTFTEKQSLFQAIEQAGADQVVDTLFLIGHGSENGSFGPSPNERLQANAAMVVPKLLLAKLLLCLLSSALAEMPTCSFT